MHKATTSVPGAKQIIQPHDAQTKRAWLAAAMPGILLAATLTEPIRSDGHPLREPLKPIPFPNLKPVGCKGVHRKTNPEEPTDAVQDDGHAADRQARSRQATESLAKLIAKFNAVPATRPAPPSQTLANHYQLVHSQISTPHVCGTSHVPFQRARTTDDGHCNPLH